MPQAATSTHFTFYPFYSTFFPLMKNVLDNLVPQSLFELAKAVFFVLPLTGLFDQGKVSNRPNACYDKT